MSPTVRRASSDDLDAIVPLFDAYRQFYAQPSDPALARDYLAERLQRHESVILLAMQDGRAMGFTQLYPMFSSVRVSRTWILNDLYVDAQARRGGVARSLLDAAAQFARDDGAVGISLETTRDNAAARALYRSAGWHEDDTQWYRLSLATAGGTHEAVFSYGTLQDEAVQQRLFGRRLEGSPDALPGFRKDWLDARDPAAVAASGVVKHPVARRTGADEDRVDGMLLRVSRDELHHADEYEAPDYRRVRVALASGRNAWLYVAAS